MRKQAQRFLDLNQIFQSQEKKRPGNCPARSNREVPCHNPDTERGTNEINLSYVSI